MPKLKDDIKMLKEGDGKPKFVFDQNVLQQIMGMGFTENAAKKSLIEKKNDLASAIEWLFEKSGDPSLNLPLEEDKSK